MRIQAYDRIFQYLSEEILERNLGASKNPKVRKIVDFNELDQFFASTSNGVSIKFLKTRVDVTEVRAEEWTYDNGLKYIICELDIKEKFDEEQKTFEKRILTTSDLKQPILVLDFIRERMGIEEFIFPTRIKRNSIPEHRRTIEKLNLSVYSGGFCTAAFKEVRNVQTKELIIEGYKQYYRIIKPNEQQPNKLIELCGCGGDWLEILYCDSNPIFAQFSEKEKVEKIGYIPDSKENIGEITKIISNEVDNIIDEISMNIKKFQKPIKKGKRKVKKLES